MEPQHHLGQETTAIDVKDLLAAAPVNAPTLEQLTSELNESSKVTLIFVLLFPCHLLYSAFFCCRPPIDIITGDHS